MRLTVEHEALPLHTPFRIARGVKTVADVVVVRLEDEDGDGWGEGVPYPRYGESVAGTIAAIEAVRPAVEAGVSRRELLELLPAGAARNAVDGALWSYHGDAPPAPGLIATALTIGIDTPDAMARAAAALAGARLLKVKVDALDPAARIRAVRAAAPEARLIIDPNESWDRTLLAAMAPVLVEAGVALLEQPVPAGADEWLASFDLGVPICADESFHGMDDLDAVVGRYTHVNIKLDKTGGLTAALEVAAAARARGMGLMVGCMISSSLSIAPALRIADMCEFVDLDGPLWLAEDRPGGVSVRDGLIRAPLAFWA